MRFKTVFLLLILQTPLSGILAQSLSLKAEGSNPDETAILNTLNYRHRHPDFNSIATEVKSITDSIAYLGYLESTLKDLNKVNDSTFMASYHLGPHFPIARIYYDANIDKDLLKPLSGTVTDSYFEIEIQRLEATLEHLNVEIASSGDPFASLQLVNIRKANDRLLADLKVSQREGRHIDSIIVKGYKKFPKSFIKHYLKIKNKQVFNLNLVKQKTESLEHLQFASQIKAPEVLFTNDSTLLYLYIEKQKSNSFDGFLGFGTNDQTGKLEFNGYLTLSLANNLNYGETFRLRYQSDESEQKTFDITAKLPYLLSSPIGIQVGLNIFKKDSSFVTTSQMAQIEYQINAQHQIHAKINYQSSTDLRDTPIATINDFNTTFYAVGYQYTLQQHDQLFPVNFSFGISAGTGKRSMLDQQQSQVKFELDAFKILNLNLRNSIYGRVTAAVLNSTDFVENELFRFGGINSIRGFEENSLAANLFGVFNTEYRYKLTNTLYVNSIIDVAYYENDLLATKSKLLGFGFGFGMLTQAGLLKLNYSNGSTENQAIKLSNSKIHISLTAVF